MKLRGILIDWFLLYLNLNSIIWNLLILNLGYYTLRLTVSVLPVIMSLWWLILAHAYAISVAEVLLIIWHHWISIGWEVFLHSPRHIKSVLHLLLELHLFELTLVIQISDFILKRLNFSLIILFYLVRSLPLFLYYCFVPCNILFKLGILSFSCLEYAFHLNIRPLMLTECCFKLIILSHYLSKTKLLSFKCSFEQL